MSSRRKGAAEATSNTPTSSTSNIPQTMTTKPPSSNTSSNIPARFSKAIVTGASKVVPIRKTRGMATPVGPQPGEQPAFNLKVRVCSCKDLLAMDSNGKSDPCVFFLSQYLSPHSIL